MRGGRVLPATTPRFDEIRRSLPVIGFNLVLLVFTSLLVAFWSAVQTAGRSASGSRAQFRLREFLVISEIALTALLVAGAGLLFRRLLASYIPVRRALARDPTQSSSYGVVQV
jgi:hypothetical protein